MDTVLMGEFSSTSEAFEVYPEFNAAGAYPDPPSAFLPYWLPALKVTDSQPENLATGTLRSESASSADPVLPPVALRLQSMSETLHRIADLRLGEEWGYDADYLAPTLPAYEATWELVSAAATECTLPFPTVSAGPLGDGGLSLQWGGQERYVRLLMPPDPKDAYLYSQGPGVHFLDAARPELLARRIVWLLEG